MPQGSLHRKNKKRVTPIYETQKLHNVQKKKKKKNVRFLLKKR